MENSNRALYLYESSIANALGLRLNETYNVFRGMDNTMYLTSNNNPDNINRVVVRSGMGFETVLTSAFVYSRIDETNAATPQRCTHSDKFYEGFRESYFFCTKCDTKSTFKRG